jgi:E3 ubiquitin-protein ligase RNF115/126
MIKWLIDNDENNYDTPPTYIFMANSIPMVEIFEIHLNSDFSQCDVCLEEYELGGDACYMQCKHMFHYDCIHPWFNMHISCLMCFL